MPPDQIITRSGQVEPHASGSYSRRITEPRMGGFPTESFCQVRWTGLCLKYRRLPIRDLAMEGRRYLLPFHSLLIQRALNVEEVGH